MNATIFKITEKRAHDRQNDSLKLANQKQIIRQLLQTGTDEKPSSKTVSQVLLISYNSIKDKNNV
jgi:hypothetical protein